MNNFLVWLDVFRVGHPLLDEQRAELFELINEMWRCREGRLEQRREAFLRICRHLEAHWALEEGLCRESGCACLAEQEAQHADLRRKLRNIRASCGKDGKTWYALMVVLIQDLLLHHLTEVDLSCKKHFQPATAVN